VRAARRLKRSSESGQAVVELAIILPVILIIMLGIAEFGFLIYNQMVLDSAARDGARVYALSSTGCASSSPCSAAQTAATSAATGLISCSSPTATSSQSSPGFSFTSNASAKLDQVSVSCTYTPVTPLGSLVNVAINRNRSGTAYFRQDCAGGNSC
jgi:Flp pilus assembly protein TadG